MSDRRSPHMYRGTGGACVAPTERHPGPGPDVGARFIAPALCGVIVLILAFWADPAGAQTFVLRPSGETITTTNDGGAGCTATPIVTNAANARDGNFTTSATISVDAATPHCVSGSQLNTTGPEPLPCDLVIEWSGFVGGPNTPPTILISPGDTIFLRMEIVDATADAAAASPCNAIDVGPDTFLDTPALGGEWRIEALIDQDGIVNGSGFLDFDNDDIDGCDGTDEIGLNLPCGAVPFSTTSGGSIGSATTVSTVDLQPIITATPPIATTPSDPAPANTGDGTMTLGARTRAALNEVWTATFDGAVWNVTGSVSGAQTATATTGTPYTVDNGSVGFTINAGGVAYVAGDDFQFVVLNLFSLTEQIWARVRAQPNVVNGSTLRISDVRLDIGLTSGGSAGGLILPGTSPGPFLKNQAIAGVTGDVNAIGGAPPYTWNNGENTAGQISPPLTGVSSLPNNTQGQLVDNLDGSAPDWQISGTPNNTGGNLVVGDHYFTVRVTDTTPITLTSSYDAIVDGLDIAPRTLPTLTPGQFESVVLRAVSSDALGNGGGSTSNLQWTLSAAPCELDGMSFSSGLTCGGSVSGLDSLTLDGTPDGLATVNFTLSLDDTSLTGGGPVDTAFQDSVTYVGNGYAAAFRMIDRQIPDVVQGMQYDGTPEFPYLVRLQASGAPGTPYPTSPPDGAPFQVTAPTEGIDVPPGTGVLQLIDASVTQSGDAAFVSIGTADTTEIPVTDQVAGRYAFTLEVQDGSSPTPFAVDKDFTIRVLPRRTLILSGPSKTSEETVLTFTVFAEGGVPTGDDDPAAGVTETRHANAADPLTTVVPRYALEYAVDAQQDTGAYLNNWIPLTTVPGTGAWPHATSPVTVSIDLNNDAGITDATLTPSASTGRRYRVRFRASDGLTRAVDGRTAESPLAEASTVVRVVAPGGEDTNPNPPRPTRLRQERFD